MDADGSIGNFTTNSTQSSDSVDDANTTAASFTDDQIISAYYVEFVLYPILLLLGTVGNSLNLLVLWRMKSRTSTTVYLTVVAVADLTVLWLFMGEYLYGIEYETVQSNDTLKDYLASYYRTNGLRRWGFESALQISDWTLLIFSCERLLKSVRPLYFRDKSSVKLAVTTETVLLALCGLFTLFEPVESYYCLSMYPLTDSDPVLDLEIDKCDNETAWLSRWRSLQLPAEMAVVLAKFLGILVINVALACSLKRSLNSSGTMAGVRRASAAESLRSAYLKSNVIVCASAVLFIVSQLPTLVFQCLVYARQYGTYNFSDAAQAFMTPFDQMAFLANYSLNFYLYFSVSRRFRDELRSVYGSWRQKVRSLLKEPPVAALSLPMTLTSGGGSQLTMMVSNCFVNGSRNSRNLPHAKLETETKVETDESSPTTPEAQLIAESGISRPRFSIVG